MGEEGRNNNKGEIPSWVERVDKLLDVSPRYVTALRSAFIRFQTPPPNAILPRAHLLLALQFLVQKITDELDAKVGKLCLRPITQDDIDAVLQSDRTINIERPINIKCFDEIARKVLKRVALERGKRLGFFIVGGILVVHLLKGTVRKIPFIGPTVGTVVNMFMPTTVFGAAAGIAGAMHT
uniref:Uncharacterized protein n=1 Tax=Picea sitchensis TaxID=3332 RepID=D5A990_PICSI|nr:unknown [Picea sitchensis]